MMMLKNPFLKLFRAVFFFLPFLFLVISIVSCGEEKKAPAPTSNKIIIKQEFKDKVAEKRQSDDYLLLENSCLYCHTIGTLKEKEVAPTMQEVRDVYKQSYSSKEAFIQSFIDFCENPIKEKSLMPNAIEQFGLKDDAGHAKEDVEDIAAYLFDYQF